MIILKVPYAEKDEAKALGARWNKERKIWYVPDGADGADGAPFKRWIAPGNAGPASAPAAKAARVDTLSGKPSVGAHYLDLGHDCNPFADCPDCRPKLEASGWLAQHQLVRQMLAGLSAPR